MRASAHTRTLRPLLRQATALVVAGVILGAVSAGIHPRRPPLGLRWADLVAIDARALGIERMPPDTVRAAAESQTHLILDARLLSAYEDGRLPGAVSLPASALAERFPIVHVLLVPGEPILVYDAGPPGEDALRLGAHLVEQGYGPVLVMPEGFEGWRGRDWPIEVGAGPL